MSTGSIIIAVTILVVFASLDSSVDASTTVLFSLTATPIATPTVTPSSSSAQTAPAQGLTPTSTTSAGGAVSVTSSPSVAPTEAPRQKTCGNIKFMVMAGSMYTNQTELQNLLERGVFNESSKYEDVKVSGLQFSKKEGKEEVKFKLCVIKKDNAGYIEDMLIAGFKYNNVKVTEFEFTGDGVSFKDWKAKADECSKCSETGGGGPIVIEGTCVPKADHSCKGLKNTDESNDCVKYCDSSAAAIMMSSFILAMGILMSFSFSIWN